MVCYYEAARQLTLVLKTWAQPQFPNQSRRLPQPWNSRRACPLRWNQELKRLPRLNQWRLRWRRPQAPLLVMKSFPSLEIKIIFCPSTALIFSSLSRFAVDRSREGHRYSPGSRAVDSRESARRTKAAGGRGKII